MEETRRHGRRGESQDPGPLTALSPTSSSAPNVPLSAPAQTREVLLATSTQRTCLQGGTSPLPTSILLPGPHLRSQRLALAPRPTLPATAAAPGAPPGFSRSPF